MEEFTVVVAVGCNFTSFSHRRFPEGRIPNYQTFRSMFNYLQENGTFPKSKSGRALDP